MEGAFTFMPCLQLSCLVSTNKNFVACSRFSYGHNANAGQGANEYSFNSLIGDMQYFVFSTILDKVRVS